ncbi:MAG: (Fe-S)-binding protein [Clostridia bacterium]|nr:(Fe-S)-binding protein [Clostridia bacterium]
MLISQKSKQIVDSCRFCWMCRHICPIGNATGQERNTARARALTLSLVERGAADYSGGIADNVYECALCGACTKECATGWDPVKFTKETRNEIVMSGTAPAYITKLIETLSATGNVYGKTALCDDLKKAIDSVSAKTDVLFFLGSDARYAACKQATGAIEMLKKAGVKFTVLADEHTSGYAWDFLVGAADETKSAMAACAKALNEFKTVVCYDPADAKVMIREYKEYGIDLKAEVKTFTAFLAEKIADGSLKAAKTGKTLYFQDPALLARDLEETKPARDVLAACGEVKEMLLFGKDVMWAGSSMMALYMPKVMKLVAERRWADLAHVDGKVMVTASPSEYAALAAVKPEGMELYTIEEVVKGC